MVLKDAYRLPLEPFRFRVPNTVTNATPGTKPLLDPATYAMFEELDSQIIRYLLDLNLECRVRRSLWEKYPIQVKNLKRPLLSSRLDEISRALMPVNERFHLNASYKIVQTAFAADLLLLMGRDALNASMQHPVLNGLMDLHREQLKKDKETGIRIDIGTSTQYEQWKTVQTWVGSCPFPAARQAAIDITASAPKPKQLLKGAIEPVSDVLFLRKMNSSLSSKLHLTLLLLQEEVGLSLLDSSPHAFAMCYLYTALHIKGALSRDKFGFESSDQEKRDRSSEGAPSGSNIVMHDIEAICEQHGPELFGSLDFSDSTARIADVTKIRAGSPSPGAGRLALSSLWHCFETTFMATSAFGRCLAGSIGR
ncbi:hypothetical protein SLS60_012014 [Paraconiothyrium brasiliense]|uniref:Uncharacterized protein n=1 Tax=Paraconiothyrium brasiliense TaxID=300254 RepID=A0ABR3QGV8_9PLEO